MYEQWYLLLGLLLLTFGFILIHQNTTYNSAIHPKICVTVTQADSIEIECKSMRWSNANKASYGPGRQTWGVSLSSTSIPINICWWCHSPLFYTTSLRHEYALLLFMLDFKYDKGTSAHTLLWPQHIIVCMPQSLTYTESTWLSSSLCSLQVIYHLNIKYEHTSLSSLVCNKQIICLFNMHSDL